MLLFIKNVSIFWGFFIYLLADTGADQTHIYRLFPAGNFVQVEFDNSAQNQIRNKIS